MHAPQRPEAPNTIDVLALGETMALLVAEEPAIDYHRRGSAASQLGMADFNREYALQARHVHTTGITPALSTDAHAQVAHMMRSLRDAGRSVSFGPNLRPSLWPDTDTMRNTLNALATLADWVLPGIAEGRLLTGRDTPAEIVDTVDAGDAFAGGIISARLEGRTWPQALTRALWIAARALQVLGDMEGLPRRSELPAKLAG